MHLQGNELGIEGVLYCDFVLIPLFLFKCT